MLVLELGMRRLVVAVLTDLEVRTVAAMPPNLDDSRVANRALGSARFLKWPMEVV